MIQYSGLSLKKCMIFRYIPASIACYTGCWNGISNIWKRPNFSISSCCYFLFIIFKVKKVKQGTLTKNIRKTRGDPYVNWKKNNSKKKCSGYIISILKEKIGKMFIWKKFHHTPMTHEGNFNLPFFVSIQAPVPCQCLVLVLWLLTTDESNK